MTVRSGWECLVGRNIFGLPYVTVPIHVEEHDPRQALISAQQRIPLNKQAREMVHHLIKRQMILPFGDDIELKLFNDGLVQAEKAFVLRCSKEGLHLRRVL